jgi:Fe2+ or Zn2+ uptake regulation protein
MSERDDIDGLIRSVLAARALLADYIQPGPRSAVDTVDRLLDVLDARQLVATLDRLNRRRVIRLVEE